MRHGDQGSWRDMKHLRCPVHKCAVYRMYVRGKSTMLPTRYVWCPEGHTYFRGDEKDKVILGPGRLALEA
ncbi:hypothetical protein ES703_117830 [subsurface metagenome]